MLLSLTSRLCGNVFVIHCQGRIVAGDEVKALETALDLAAREVPRIVLHVTEVERLDSVGIGLLVRYAARLRKRGGDIRLAAPPQCITALLKLTMLSSVLPVHPTEDEAILSFLTQSAQPKAQQKPAPARVLVLDQSADLCAFVRSVLVQHDFEVRSASLVGDRQNPAPGRRRGLPPVQLRQSGALLGASGGVAESPGTQGGHVAVGSGLQKLRALSTPPQPYSGYSEYDSRVRFSGRRPGPRLAVEVNATVSTIKWLRPCGVRRGGPFGYSCRFAVDDNFAEGL